MRVGRMSMVLVVWAAGVVRGAVHEVILSPELVVEAGRPATEINWRADGLLWFDAEGSIFTLGGFSGRLEVPDGFDQYFGGSALLEVTGRDAARVIVFDDLAVPDGDGFDDGFVLSDFYAAGAGKLRVLGRETGDGLPRLYEVGAGGVLTETVEGVAQVDGTGARTGRTVFHRTSFGKREAILALEADGSTGTVVALGAELGGGLTLEELRRVQVNRQGRVAFYVKLAGEGVVFTNEIALLREVAGGGVETVARSGVAHPADARLVAGGLFGRLNPQAVFGLNDAGVVAFEVSVTSDTYPSGSASSIWRSVPGREPELVVVAGERQGTRASGEVVFESYTGLPIVDAMGSVLFLGRTRPASSNVESVEGLWRWRDGELERLVLLKSPGFPLPPMRVAGRDGEGAELSYTMELDEVMGFQTGPGGRVALRAIVAEVERKVVFPAGGGEPEVVTSRERMAQGVWAQDEDGGWELVQVYLLRRDHGNNPVADGTGDLLVAGAGDLGRIVGLYLGETRFVLGSGGEDGLMPRWWTDDGRLVYQAVVRNGGVAEAYTLLARVGRGTVATAGRFVWDGGAATLDWATAGNWVNDEGERWGRAPGGQATDDVLVGESEVVVVDRDVGVVGSLDVGGRLEVNAGGVLRVAGEAVLEDMVVGESGRFVAEGDVGIYGDVLGAESGLKSEPAGAGRTVRVEGNVTGVVTGVWSVCPEGVVLVNEGSISGIDGAGVLVVADGGDVRVENHGSVDSSGTKAMVVRSGTGRVEVHSPGAGAAGGNVKVSGSDDGILAESGGEVLVVFSGELVTIGNRAEASAVGIHVDSTGAGATVLSAGEMHTSGVASGIGVGAGIWAKGFGDVSAKHDGSISATGWGIRGESEAGDVVVDSSGAVLATESGGLFGIADSGNVRVIRGEVGVANGNGVTAVGSGHVRVEGSGGLTAGGGRPQQSAAGIWAVSTGGRVTVSSGGEISTTHTAPSPGIYAVGEAGVEIVNDGGISTFNGGGIWVESGGGDVVIEHGGGGIAATNDGRGISAVAASGAVEITGRDALSGIGTQGVQRSEGIYAEAGDWMRIDWAGDILSAGDGVRGVGGAGGVEVVTRGSVAGLGDGVSVSGDSVLTVRVLGGGVRGEGAGVRFDGGTTNWLVNAGAVTRGGGGPAVAGGGGGEVVENSGVIGGDILLGGGANGLRNVAGGVLVDFERIEVGAGNVLENSGVVGVGGGATLVGDLVQEAGGVLEVEVTAGRLGVGGVAELGGTLRLKVGRAVVAGEMFEVLSAGEVRGRFSGTDQVTVGGGVRFDLVYEKGRVVVVAREVVPLSYGDWRLREFGAADAGDESVSGFTVDVEGDGLVNLLEFVYGGDPVGADGDPFVVSGSGVVGGRRYLDVAFPWVVGAGEAVFGFESMPGDGGPGWVEREFEVLGGESGGEVELIRARVYFGGSAGPGGELVRMRVTATE